MQTTRDWEKIVLENLYRRGVRYPISYAGAEQDLAQAFPGSYGSLGQLGRETLTI